MSAESLPISTARFSKALNDLSLSSLYLKVAELRNSIGHLLASNVELEKYARDTDDRDCYEALLENREVMKRFEERIELIKKEVVEVRCLPWMPDEGENRRLVDGERAEGSGGESGTAQRSNGNASDLDRSRIVGANGSTNTDGEEGVFL